MPTNSDLIERSGTIKRELFEFVMQPRFERDVAQAIEHRFGPAPTLDESEIANFMDWFILQHRPSGGRTVVEQFVSERRKLPQEEREMLLGWGDVVEGLFDVKERDGEALVVVNLLDDLTYRVRSNMGSSVFRQMRPGSILITRLVPFGNEWLMSGISEMLPAAHRQDV
jgi:hypothetical protein